MEKNMGSERETSSIGLGGYLRVILTLDRAEMQRFQVQKPCVRGELVGLFTVVLRISVSGHTA